MWVIKFVPLALLGACVGFPDGPSARVFYGDLALESSASRAELRRRVATSARQFCERHGDDVTPGELRINPSYCLEMLRSSIVDAMPREVRKSYALALREAGVRQWEF